MTAYPFSLLLCLPGFSSLRSVRSQRPLMDRIQQCIVVQGSNSKRTNKEDAFRVPKQLGICHETDSGLPDFTVRTVIRRIIDNRSIYMCDAISNRRS
jgi:hypothetical protein